MTVRWVPIVTDLFSFPCESGYHGSQHTDSPQVPHAFHPRPQVKCSSHSDPPDLWGSCPTSCMDSVTPREFTSRSLSLSQTHCLHAELTLWISRKNLTLFPSPKICVPPSWLIFCFSVPEKYFAPIGKVMWGYGLWAGRCICGPGQAVCSQRGQQ